MKTAIPKWVQDKYGRYAPQAYACLSRNGRSLKNSWDSIKKQNEALNGSKQLKIEL